MSICPEKEVIYPEKSQSFPKKSPEKCQFFQKNVNMTRSVIMSRKRVNTSKKDPIVQKTQSSSISINKR